MQWIPSGPLLEVKRPEHELTTLPLAGIESSLWYILMLYLLQANNAFPSGLMTENLCTCRSSFIQAALRHGTASVFLLLLLP